MTGEWGSYYYWNARRSHAKTRALMFFYYRYLMKNKLIGLDIRGQKVQLCKKLRIKFLLFSIIYIWLISTPAGSEACVRRYQIRNGLMRNLMSRVGIGGIIETLNIFISIYGTKKVLPETVKSVKLVI